MDIELYLHRELAVLTLMEFCGNVVIVLFLCLCHCRNPVAVKRPNSAVKQQRKDSPGLQHRGAVSGGRGQANPKPDRPGPRGTKAKDDKVRLQRLIGG